MARLFVVLALATAANAGDAAFSSTVEEAEALAIYEEECWSSEGACALSTLQLRASAMAANGAASQQAPTTRRRRSDKEVSACAKQGSYCGFLKAKKTCCGNSQCLKGTWSWQCKGIAALEKEADREESACKKKGEVCGNHWGSSDKCCGSGKCERLLGGDGTMKCTGGGDHAQCKREGEVCGNHWGSNSKCCGSGRCERLLGGDGTMKCTGGNCVAHKGVCGGSGQLDQKCCSGECKRSEWWNSFSKKICE